MALTMGIEGAVSKCSPLDVSVTGTLLIGMFITKRVPPHRPMVEPVASVCDAGRTGAGGGGGGATTVVVTTGGGNGTTMTVVTTGAGGGGATVVVLLVFVVVDRTVVGKPEMTGLVVVGVVTIVTPSGGV